MGRTTFRPALTLYHPLWWSPQPCEVSSIGSSDAPILQVEKLRFSEVGWLSQRHVTLVRSLALERWVPGSRKKSFYSCFWASVIRTRLVVWLKWNQYDVCLKGNRISPAGSWEKEISWHNAGSFRYQIPGVWLHEEFTLAFISFLGTGGWADVSRPAHWDLETIQDTMLPSNLGQVPSFDNNSLFFPQQGDQTLSSPSEAEPPPPRFRASCWYELTWTESPLFSLVSSATCLTWL